MGTRIIITTVTISIWICLTAQQDVVKFRNYVFSDVFQQSTSANHKYHRADIYLPAGDSSTGRPLIIWIHGGAFKFGSKKATGTSLWCETFAMRGYVCAAINYRLNKRRPLFTKKSFFKGCYEALQDLHEALFLFKQHAAKLRIDTIK